MSDIKELWRLFISFFRIGLFTFGGGYSMLPMLKRETVEKRGWATEDELLDYFAVGQCTPGVIAVNTATFVGFSQKKLAGAVAATLGVVFPSLVIITLIAALLGNFSDNVYVGYAFSGIRVAVGAMILSTVVGLIRKNVRSALQIFLCVVAFVVVAVFGRSPVWVVAGAAFVGFFFGKRGEKE